MESKVKKKLLLLTLSLLFSVAASAKSKVRAVHYKAAQSQRGKITISLKGPLSDTPELLVKNNMIQLSVPDSFVWPKIEKKISIKNTFDTTVLAYQYNKGTVRVRAMLPYSLAGLEDAVNVTIKDNNIILDFPKRGRFKSVKTYKKSNTGKLATAYDESYLEKLLKDKATMQKKYGSELAPLGKKESRLNANKKTVNEDEVKMALSAQNKISPDAGNSSFSIMSYVGKFVAFLGLVLLLFYGVVTLMRKGVMKKGKLGFLNSTKMVEVLSTTYIAPKKSVMMIRAHNQVFLVGSSDAGLQSLGEVTDITGLLKEGEKQVAGNNFDSSLFEAGAENKEFKLKDMAPASEGPKDNGLATLLAENAEKEKVKFSDQIKNKVKNLKSFQ